MVHIEFDTSPISVSVEYEPMQPDGKGKMYSTGRTRPVVWCHDESVWVGEYEKWWSGPDEDELKSEWDRYFQQFITTAFKEWLKTNGPGEEE